MCLQLLHRAEVGGSQPGSEPASVWHTVNSYLLLMMPWNHC